MSTEWTWPEGKTFGQLTPDEKRLAAQRAGAQLEAELTANVDAISRIMNADDLDGGVDLCHICGDEADGACAICERPVCDEDAARKDYDRFCRTCAPHPGGA